MGDQSRERERDDAAVERLVDAGFGPGRFAKTAYRLREGVAPDSRLSLSLRRIPKHTGFWGRSGSGQSLWGRVPALLLGPLAVDPTLRGRGIGIALMQRGIEEARALGYESVVLVGDEPYYAKVGFTKLKPGQIRFPDPSTAIACWAWR